MARTVGQSSKEENQRRLLKTIEEVITEDLLAAAMDKAHCIETCKKLKEEVHSEVNALIIILRERELVLCLEIEKAYSAQVQKIDQDVTANCVGKITKTYDENRRSPSKTTLVFNSDFDALKRRLNCFGQLRYENTEELAKKMYQEFLEASKRWDPILARAEDAPSAASPVGLASIATSWAENATPLSFAIATSWAENAGPLSFGSPVEVVDSIANSGRLSFASPVDVVDSIATSGAEIDGSLSFPNPVEVVDSIATSWAKNDGLLSFASPVEVVDSIATSRTENDGSLPFASPVEVMDSIATSGAENDRLLSFASPVEVMDSIATSRTENDGSLPFASPVEVDSITKHRIANEVDYKKKKKDKKKRWLERKRLRLEKRCNPERKKRGLERKRLRLERKKHMLIDKAKIPNDTAEVEGTEVPASSKEGSQEGKENPSLEDKKVDIHSAVLDKDSSNASEDVQRNKPEREATSLPETLTLTDIYKEYDAEKSGESSFENEKMDEDDEIFVCPPVKPPTPPVICLNEGTESEPEDVQRNERESAAVSQPETLTPTVIDKDYGTEIGGGKSGENSFTFSEEMDEDDEIFIYPPVKKPSPPLIYLDDDTESDEESDFNFTDSSASSENATELLCSVHGIVKLPSTARKSMKRVFRSPRGRK